jgi:hypothetical protein
VPSRSTAEYEEHPCQNPVGTRDGDDDIFPRHVRNLERTNVHLNFQTNAFPPAAMIADIDGLGIDNFKAPVAAGMRTAVFSAEARGLMIRNSPAVEK